VILGLINCWIGISYLDVERRTKGAAFICYSIWVGILVLFWIFESIRVARGASKPVAGPGTSPIAPAAPASAPAAAHGDAEVALDK
jgi:hypothetical protein